MTTDERSTYSDMEAIDTSSTSTASSDTGTGINTLATRRPSYWNEKFLAEDTTTARSNPSDAPEPVPPVVPIDEKKQLQQQQAIGTDVSPVDTLPPPPPAAYYLVDSKGQAQALYTVPTSAASDRGSIIKPDYPPYAESTIGGGAMLPPREPGSANWWHSLGEGRRICGVRKNIFLAAAGGVCALVFGLLITILVVTHTTGDGMRRGGGGGSGSGSASGSGSSNMPGSASDIGPAFSRAALLEKMDMGPVMAASDMAAMNWTDLNTQVTYTGVVYQSSAATGSALMLAAKNDRTLEWSFVNISQSAATVNLDILPGSPIAAATNNGLWNIYFLSSTRIVSEVWATNPLDPKGWAQGWTSNQVSRPFVQEGSGLGAMWQMCDECDNALFLVYQEAQAGDLVYVNMTNLTWGQDITISTTALPGTPAVISPFTDTGPKVKTGNDKNAIRIYYEAVEGLMELIKGPLGGGQIRSGNFGQSDMTINFYSCLGSKS